MYLITKIRDNRIISMEVTLHLHEAREIFKNYIKHFLPREYHPPYYDYDFSRIDENPNITFFENKKGTVQILNI